MNILGQVMDVFGLRGAGHASGWRVGLLILINHRVTVSRPSCPYAYYPREPCGLDYDTLKTRMSAP